MVENGFVKLQRSIAKKQWFEEAPTLRLYITMLFNAAFKETELNGIKVKKGQMLTSLQKLAEMTELSFQQVRTALKHLKQTNDINIETTMKFTLITLLDETSEPNVNTSDEDFVNTHVNKEPNKAPNKAYIVEESKEEGKEERKEEGKEEVPPACALPCESNSFLSSRDEREELIEKYGLETVTKYERKFEQWASKKRSVNAKLYPTIAKWLAEDEPKPAPKTVAAPKSAPSPAPPEGIRCTKPYRAPELESLRRQALNKLNAMSINPIVKPFLISR